jgi:imidazoleglycerol phosphate synthase glutamine amidotransferase subunit HisH
MIITKKIQIKNADQIFIPGVGEKIQEHYGYNLHK